MSLTVRYPTGHTVVYQNANYVIHGQDKFQLKTKQDGSTVALIAYASGACVEFEHPSNIKTEFNTLDDALQYVVNNLDTETSLNTWGARFRFVRRLKRLLRRFDARDGRWRG